MSNTTVIHAHHSPRPVSGEMKRIMNIDNDVAGLLGDYIIEVEFYSLRSYKFVKNEGRFTLSDEVKKKYYIPNLERLGILNDIWCSLVILFLFAKHKPQYYIEEWRLTRGIQRINNLFGKRTTIGLDLHGAAPEEFEYLTGKINKLLKNQEQRSVRQADFIICQSDEMKRYLTRKHKAEESKIGVYRCGVEPEVFKYSEQHRADVRKQLGMADDEILFVYSGGMHKWQRVADTLSFFDRFHKKYPKSKVMVLTKDVDGLNRIIDENNLAGIKEVLIVRSLSYKEVPAYLCAADVSFLLRDDVVMNQVASPTKLAEYMACGLPVLSTKVADKWVDETGQAFVIDIENNNVDDIKGLIQLSSKEQIAQYAIDSLSLNTDRQNVKKFVERL